MQCDKKGDSEISESPFLLVMIIGTYLYWTNFVNSPKFVKLGLDKRIPIWYTTNHRDTSTIRQSEYSGQLRPGKTPRGARKCIR